MFSTEVLTIPFDCDGKKRLALNPYWQGFLSDEDKAKLKGYIQAITTKSKLSLKSLTKISMTKRLIK